MPNVKGSLGLSKYRPDIDGLRAVAVLLVVFDHLKMLRFQGGYIGVDVFFVISGYLIGAAILSEMGSGKFSIVSFYERRIRRIVPALFVMLAGASVLAYRYFLPTEMIAYGASLVAALFSYSNVLFWQQAGYFDVASESKPLLHTWSLGVEEQFYIFFPLFLVAVRRWAPSRLKAALWTATAASFLVTLFYMHRGDTATAFFLSPLRAWELLMGVMASQAYLPKVEGRVQRNLASFVGISLILGANFGYTSLTSFPGISALLPCLGAVLLIEAGDSGTTLVGQALSWRPIVFIGLISYSLYLWHWPILVFLNASLAVQDSRWPISYREVRYAVLFVSLIVATLSWRFVETPFRKGRLRPGRQWLFVVSGAGAAVLLAIGMIMTNSQGLPSRFAAEVVRVDAYSIWSGVREWRQGQCFVNIDNDFTDFDRAVCLRDDPTRKHYLLFGDSHAADKYVGLLRTFPALNISQATASSCPPLLHEPVYVNDNCRNLSAYIFGDYLIHNHVDAVILSARWNEENGELGRTIAWIQQRGMAVILIGPGIEFSIPLPKVVAISIRDGRPNSFIGSYRDKRVENLDRVMQNLARTQWKVRYISMYDDLCTSQVEMEAKAQPESASGCPIYASPGVPLLWDRDHLSLEGSIRFAEAIRARGQLDLSGKF